MARFVSYAGVTLTGATVLLVFHSVTAAPMWSSTSIVAPTDSTAGLSSVVLPPVPPDGLFGTSMLIPSFQAGRSVSDKICIGTNQRQNAPSVPFNTVASSTVEVFTLQSGLLPRSVGCNDVLTFAVGGKRLGTQTEGEISGALTWGMGWPPFYVYVTRHLQPAQAKGDP